MIWNIILIILVAPILIYILWLVLGFVALALIAGTILMLFKDTD